MYEFLFFICLPIIAFLYAAVGHGGASGYLALMSFFTFAATDVKAIALTLNLFVAGIAFIQYLRAGHFNKRLFIVLASASVPLAYLGGRVELNTELYFTLLAIFLLLAGVKLFFASSKKNESTHKMFSVPIALVLGASIGFISGLLGIGGGIILSPLILFFGWSDAKTTAGISALFIFVNSTAGLFGQLSTGFKYPSTMPMIIALVVIGGGLGAYLGSKKWPELFIKQLLAFVLILASLKILVS